MPKKVIHIPNFIKEDKLSPQIQFILKVFTDIENDEYHDSFEIDFSRTKFCSCFLLGILHSIILQLRKEDKVIEMNINGSVRYYLDLIHFDAGFLIDKKELIDELHQYSHKSYLPIVHFPRFGRWDENEIPSEVCINALLKLIYEKTSADADFRNDVSFIISEITDNIIDHSESNIGLITAQYYPSKNILDIVISDTGQGIFNSYKRNENFSPSTNEDAMRFALEGKSSKNELETRGFGLEGSRERIMNRSSLGRFMMWSGESIYIELKGVKEMINVGTGIGYKGCILFIRLSC